jgi:hypothetical protein
MDLVTEVEEVFGEVAAVLAGDSGDESAFGQSRASFKRENTMIVTARPAIKEGRLSVVSFRLRR